MHDNMNVNGTAAGAELDRKWLLNRYIPRVCMDGGMDSVVRMSKGTLQFQNVGTIRRRTLLLQKIFVSRQHKESETVRRRAKLVLGFVFILCF